MRSLMPTEHAEQALYFRWLAHVTYDGKPLRDRVYAVPNGGHRHMLTARRLQAEGVTAGRPDVNVDVMSGGYGGLRIEAKRRGGKVTPAQQATIDMLRADGYQALVCYGFDEMRRVTVEYLKLSHRVMDRWAT